MSELEHYEHEIYAIEERISRLAIACGVDMNNSAHVTAVRQGNFVVCSYGDQSSHRQFHELLLLCDYIKLHCVGERGPEGYRDIIDDVEAKLRQHGFRD